MLDIIKILFMILYKRHLRTLKCSKYQSNIDLHIKKKRKKNLSIFSGILYYNQEI